MRLSHVTLAIAMAVCVGFLVYVLMDDRRGHRSTPPPLRETVGSEGAFLTADAHLRVQVLVLEHGGSSAAGAEVQLLGTSTYAGRADQSGRIDFDVPPGDYRAHATKHGAVADLELSLDRPREVVLRLVEDPGDGEQLREDESMSGGRIEGIVVDEAGEPMAGVQIRANMLEHLRNRGVQNGSGRFAKSRTDKSGRFSLKGLAAGKFRVIPRAPGHYGRGQEAYSDGGELRFVLAPMVVLSGRVVGEGRPLDGARVRAHLVIGMIARFSDHATTDEHGRFSLEVPPEDGVQLKIKHPHFKTLEIGAESRSRRPMTFVLEPGGRVRGIVVDARGEPVEGATIRVSVKGKVVRTVNSDAEGRWMAGGLESGKVSIQLDSVEEAHAATELLQVVVGSVGVRLVAMPGRVIAGTLYEADGSTPTRALRVAALNEAGKRVAVTRVRRTNQGSFELQGLEPGTYTLKVYSTTGRVGQWAKREGVVAGTKDVEITLRR